MELVSVIIPSYNRFKYLMDAVFSVKNQDYKNIEIIVVNDNSTDEKYYTFDFESIGVKIIHLKMNTREFFGFVSCGHVRTVGIRESKGDYIAFLDDDDIWMSNKITIQLEEMKKYNLGMSCTEGYIGNGRYDSSKKYELYNKERNYKGLLEKYHSYNSKIIDNDFPSLWDYDLLIIHNCVIGSSVLLKRDIIEKVGYVRSIRCSEEDYDCWLRVLNFTKILYIKKPLFYYNLSHGDGQDY
jgi:glycosyltransferase involved in cell wall biosynthesis